MIGFEEAIVQDQLFPAQNLPGAVCVHYPRGSNTVLSANTDTNPPTLRAIPLPPGGDGRYEEFFVGADGNLWTISDRPTSIGIKILGISLHGL